MEINSGDIVVLKTGGPQMTVDKVDAHGVMCVWFDKNRKDHRALYQPAALVKHAPAAPRKAFTLVSTRKGV